MPMLDAVQHWPLFISAGLLLNLTPGADMALVTRNAASQGFKAGAAAALGVGAGCWVHIAAAALGLSALLAGSTIAFDLLRWVGAAYLLWLGWSLLRQRQPVPQDTQSSGTEASRSTLRRMFAQGFLTNALNPKVALFFLAFVPQFIRPDAGTVFVVNATLVNLGIAWAVSALRQRLDGRPALRRAGDWLNRGVGGLFVLLGLRLAWGDGGR
jgi:threonine/homoserine/homoserine lactone efflux protein